MARHMYIDESKRDGYLLVGVVIDPAHVQEVRKLLMSLLLPGQQRIHFKSESDGRRHAILARMAALPVEAILAHAPVTDQERMARARCLAWLARTAIDRNVVLMCIERDHSLELQDRDVLREALRSLPRDRVLSTRFLPARSEPMLWVADAIAWAYPLGGRWRDSVVPLTVR